MLDAKRLASHSLRDDTCDDPQTADLPCVATGRPRSQTLSSRGLGGAWWQPSRRASRHGAAPPRAPVLGVPGFLVTRDSERCSSDSRSCVLSPLLACSSRSSSPSSSPRSPRSPRSRHVSLLRLSLTCSQRCSSEMSAMLAAVSGGAPDLLAPDNLCGHTLLRLVASGSAMIAEARGPSGV